MYSLIQFKVTELVYGKFSSLSSLFAVLYLSICVIELENGQTHMTHGDSYISEPLDFHKCFMNQVLKVLNKLTNPATRELVN